MAWHYEPLDFSDPFKVEDPCAHLIQDRSINQKVVLVHIFESNVLTYTYDANDLERGIGI